MDFYNFYTGREQNAWKWMGAHTDGQETVFRTFAPAAAGVSVVTDTGEYPMYPVHDGNFYEQTLTDMGPGKSYEYRIYQADGQVRDHCDPYGFGMELRPAHRSIVRDLSSFSFQDHSWMQARTSRESEPLNIYELHLGSWKKKGPEETGWYRYDELPDLLIPYLKECGYNYLEILPLFEYPCDESWGYQPTGFFAPTSRYGTALDLKKMIQRFHEAHIGVILDFIPVHFAVDDYGLARYDGTALYEYPHSDVGVSEWGSHTIDLCQLALGRAFTAPVKYVPVSPKEVHAFYPDGVKMVLRSGGFRDSCAIRLEGDEGWVETDDSGSVYVSDPLLLEGHTIRHESWARPVQHPAEFIACVRSRLRASAPADSLHMTHVACHAASVAYHLNRTLAFDLASRTFPQDADATKLLKRSNRAPWTL